MIDVEDNYNVVLFVKGGLSVPFKAFGGELRRIMRQHARPDWLKPRNFGVATNDGKTLFQIDLREVVVIEANEEVNHMQRLRKAEAEAAASMPPQNGRMA